MNKRKIIFWDESIFYIQEDGKIYWKNKEITDNIELVKALSDIVNINWGAK